MEIITRGFTNKKKYKDDGKMFLYKTHNGFNHNIDYSKLSAFSFVPSVIENNEERVVSNFIEGELLSSPTDQDLQLLAKNIRELHVSSVVFPKNNLKQRVQAYLKTIHEKGIHNDVIEDNYKQMMRLIGKMQRVNPMHNDIWMDNIIKDSDNKIWILDWEYATMGDKHFELAYYIESQKLSPNQREIFLNAYNAFDGKSSYNELLLPKYRKFVMWLIVTWALAQEKLPFPIDELEKNIKEHPWK